jgi:hypothetical protein
MPGLAMARSFGDIAAESVGVGGFVGFLNRNQLTLCCVTHMFDAHRCLLSLKLNSSLWTRPTNFLSLHPMVCIPSV